MDLNKYLIILYSIILFINLPIKGLCNKTKIKLNLVSEVTLTILGKNEQYILYKEKDQDLPDEIYVNNVYYDKNINKVTGLTEEINIVKMVWKEPLTSCENLFRSLENVINIDFSNFDTSHVTAMNNMFALSISLTSLDLSNFNTSIVTSMDFMFYGCYSLRYLNVDNFDTSLTTDISSMFFNCSSLTSLDLISFNTSLVTSMEGMFGGSYSLVSLDLSSFDISLVTNMLGMFFDCISLIFLNLNSFIESNSDVNLNHTFYNISDNVKLSINLENNPKIRGVIPQKIIENMDNNDICFTNSIKLNIINKICVNSCEMTDYPYEYNNICYMNCPDNTNISPLNSFLCLEKLNCAKLNKYLNYEKTQCIDKIPEGYYLKDEILKIIDICHSDCKECLKKEDEKSSNCISCLNDKFLDNGNCVLSCDNDYFEDLLGNKKCKCINNKCKECSYDSIMLDLCISCNENYYPKIDDEINENNFTNCYQDPDGYYFDNYIYKPCYESCLKCSELGDSSDNKCLECKTGYSKIDNSQNCYENCKYYYYFNSSNIYHCTEKNKCPKEQSKLIKEKNKCIKNCSDDDIYKCEINNICYECYEEKTDSINENEKECPYDTPYQLKNEDCVSECNEIDFFNGVCKISNDNSSILENMIEIIKSQLENKELEGLLSNVEDGEKKDLLIKVYNMTYQLTTTENQKNKNYTNISTINLNNCEDILKSENGIDPNKSLIIFKVDYYMEGISIPVIGYEVYNPDTKQKLSLKSCEDILINLDIPVSIDETILFKYDPNDEYYNDECFSYTTDKGTDIILNDRKKEFINNNMSLCENKCSYIGYTEKSKKASCKCDIKSTELKLSQIFDEENILSNNFTFDEYSKSNLITMKCASKLFTKNGLLTNIANYILIIFTILKKYYLIKKF